MMYRQYGDYSLIEIDISYQLLPAMNDRLGPFIFPSTRQVNAQR